MLIKSSGVRLNLGGFHIFLDMNISELKTGVNPNIHSISVQSCHVATKENCTRLKILMRFKILINHK